MQTQNSAILRCLVLLLLIILLSCGGEEYPSVRIGSATVYLEIADEPEEQRLGLMHRDSLPEDRGMLFIFPQDKVMSFWMKNTRIPLSIAYIDSAGVIREIHDMTPFSAEPVESRGSVRYALEVNAGSFAKWGVKAGDRLDLSGALEK